MNSDPEFARQIGVKALRKENAEGSKPTVWFGLGMMGLIGWSVVLPTLLGAALGRWLDSRHPASYSWTLALLAAGLVLGCFNAWNWIDKEDKAMHGKQEDPSE
jgi:ATP synthase protein I